MTNLYGVYDKKAQRYVFIMEAENVDLAKRSMYRLLERGNNDFVKFPHDFSVNVLGYYDDEIGYIKDEPNKFIAFEVASLFVRPTDPETVEDYSGSVASPSESEDIPFGESED